MAGSFFAVQQLDKYQGVTNSLRWLVRELITVYVNPHVNYCVRESTRELPYTWIHVQLPYRVAGSRTSENSEILENFKFK